MIDLTQTQSPKKTWFYTLIAFIAIVFACYELWQLWPSLMLKSIQWQREINDQLSALLHQAKQEDSHAAWLLLGFSALYGFFHALGPGHGKVIVTTYLATHPTKVKASLWLTVISALMQAVVACILVTSLLWLFSASMKEVNQASLHFIQASYGLMVLLGLSMLIASIKSLVKNRRKPAFATSFSAIDTNPIKLTETKQSLANLDEAKQSSIKQTTPTFIKAPQHQHSFDQDGACACGHKHFADAQEINQAHKFTDYLAIIASIGIRPCTGALMVLLFANLLDIYWLGVLSCFLMSVGTALSTSMIALLTVSGRKIVRKYLNLSTGSNISLGIRILGGLVLILLGTILWQGQSVGMSPILG